MTLRWVYFVALIIGISDIYAGAVPFTNHDDDDHTKLLLPKDPVDAPNLFINEIKNGDHRFIDKDNVVPCEKCKQSLDILQRELGDLLVAHKDITCFVFNAIYETKTDCNMLSEPDARRMTIPLVNRISSELRVQSFCSSCVDVDNNMIHAGPLPFTNHDDDDDLTKLLLPKDPVDAPNLVINEIKNGNHRFIELYSDVKELQLDGFFLSILDYGPSSFSRGPDQDMSSVLNLRALIPLDGKKLEEPHNMGVIGTKESANTPSWLMNFGDPSVTYFTNFHAFNVLNVPKDYRLIVTLSYLPNQKVVDFYKMEEARPLTGTLYNVITKNIVDTLFFRGRGRVGAKCDKLITKLGFSKNDLVQFFLDISPPPKSSKMIEPQSYSRCNEVSVLPKNWDMWKITKPTFGTPNLCDTGKPIQVTQNLAPIVAPEAGCSVQSFDDCGQDQVSLQISGERLQKSIDSAPEGSCPADTNRGDKATKLDAVKGRKTRVSGDDPSKKGNIPWPWESINHFKEEWVDMMVQDHGNAIPIEEIQTLKVKQWFEYLPQEKTYRCRICNKFKNLYHVPESAWSELSLDQGYIAEEMEANRFKIHNHVNSKIHRNMVDALMRDAMSYGGDIEDFIDANPHFVNAITSLVMSAVYESTYHQHAPLRGLPALIHFLESKGIDVGNNCKSYYKLRGMVHSIAKSMHQRLINTILNTDTPLVLIIDGSTGIP